MLQVATDEKTDEPQIDSELDETKLDGENSSNNGTIDTGTVSHLTTQNVETASELPDETVTFSTSTTLDEMTL